MAEMTFDEFAGTPAQPKEKGDYKSSNRPAALSFEEFANAKPDPFSPEELAKENTRRLLIGDAGMEKKSAMQRTMAGLKAAGGEAAALIDLVASAPGFILGVGAQIGGTIQAGARGENAKNAFAAGREAGHTFAEPLMNPMQKLMKLIGEDKVYEETATTKGMTKFTEAIEEAGTWAENISGGRIARDSVPMLIETLMASAAGIGGKKPGTIPEHLQKAIRQQSQKMREKGEADALTREMEEKQVTPQEQVARLPVQAQINAMLGIQSPQQRAKATRAKRKEVKQAFETPQDGSEYGSIEESQFRAEERLSNEAAQKQRIGQAEILNILEKPGQERTAEDAAVIRLAAASNEARAAARNERDSSVLEGKPPTMQEAMDIAQKEPEARTREETAALYRWSRQRGNVSNEVAGLLAAAGLTAAVLSDDDIRGAVLKGLKEHGPTAGLGAMFVPVFKGRKLTTAEALEKSGAPREQIWRQTGLFKSEDGHWREEISDHSAKIKTDKMASIRGTDDYKSPVSLFDGDKTLKDFFEHPDLFKEYPELADMPVGSTGFSFGVKGSYGEGKMRLGSGKPADILSTILHEVQHHVQEKAGLARGGNPGEFLPKELQGMSDTLYKDWQEIQKKNPDLKDKNFYTLIDRMEKINSGYETKFDFLKKDLAEAKTLIEKHNLGKLLLQAAAMQKLQNYGYKQYHRLAGEVEARATQARQKMTPLERLETPPWKSFDVPEKDWLLKFKDSQSGASMAVKEPGGMWHPEAVDRLRDPLVNNLAGTKIDRLREDRAGGALAPEEFNKAVEDLPEVQWAHRAIRNYLNKFAGTERDPLKNVEIPSGLHDSGIARWEEMMDASINLTKADDFPLLEGTKPNESVTSLDRNTQTFSDISSYLSHVGDYLRQNVKPEKLGQYDLVRAVRETADNDARVAKAMEKAAANSMKDLPVYKEYPDGFKWVELKLPERLTAEQAKQVRRASETNTKGEKTIDRGYVAITPEGKPLENVYTGEYALGKTPEEAWLAGRLAEEGNQMGHCVGGYCEGVASGESKIYSLRDPKGKSHVTVEVSPPDVRAPHNDPRHYARTVGGDLLRRLSEAENLHLQMEEVKINREIVQSPEYQAWLKTRPSDVVQIKGKQNRAPNKEYLPYVQDFVKGGKWGEVGDLGNTGLTHRDRLTPDEWAAVRTSIGDQTFYTHEEVRQAKINGPRNQEGKVDPRLVAGISALGLGAVAGGFLYPDDPIAGPLLGALAGAATMLPGAGRRLKEAARGADYLAGNISTRIKNISPRVLLAARDFERRNLTESYAYLHEVLPFMKEREKLGATEQAKLDRAVLTGDSATVAEVVKGKPELVSAVRQARNVLNDIGKQLEGHGRFKLLKGEYFPRLVKDFEGLMAALDKPTQERLEKALNDAESVAIKSRGTPLTDMERSAVVNQGIAARRHAKGIQPGYAKSRGVKEVTEDLREFYFNPAESLYAYVRSAVQDLETAKFFGKNLVQREAGGKQYIDLDTSIGNVVGQELREGKIDGKQAQELIDILQSRFRGGERSPNRLVQEVRNMTNMGLLGNIVSAATQIGDSVMTIYAQDLRSTLSAAAQMARGKERVSARDFGLADHVAEEFSSTTRSANWLNKMFKASGFSAVDRFGKTMQLNAAFNKFERLSRSESGRVKIRAEYGEAYGKELDPLMDDLRAGRLTEPVRTLLFSELSDMQPISKLELPQGYLDNPNGRIVYMLKSFMLKQFDIVRRDMVQEFAKGNRAKALKQATEYAMLLGISGASIDMVKDWMMGRDPKFEASDVLENVLKTFGWSEYTRDKAAKGKPVQTMTEIILPPAQIMDAIVNLDPRAVQFIPVVGKLFYNWELGGREEAELRSAKKAKKEGKDVDLSQRAMDLQERKRELARERKARKEAQ